VAILRSRPGDHSLVELLIAVIVLLVGTKDGNGVVSLAQILRGAKGTQGNITVGNLPATFLYDVLGSVEAPSAKNWATPAPAAEA
jgi:hypothetical protein